MTHVRTKAIREDSRLAGAGLGLNAHRMVAETAMKLAQEDFDWFMSGDNFWWGVFKRAPAKEGMILYLAAAAPLYLEPARKVLTDLLALPDDQCSVHVKDRILDALIKDTDFRANRLDLPMGDMDGWRAVMRIAIGDKLRDKYFTKLHWPQNAVRH
jgi:hypothetical protein